MLFALNCHKKSSTICSALDMRESLIQGLLEGTGPQLSMVRGRGGRMVVTEEVIACGKFVVEFNYKESYPP